jgi:hypothetical protein
MTQRRWMMLGILSLLVGVAIGALLIARGLWW